MGDGTGRSSFRARDGADPSLLPEDPALLPLRCSPMESIEMRRPTMTRRSISSPEQMGALLPDGKLASRHHLKTPPDANHKRGEWELRGPRPGRTGRDPARRLQRTFSPRAHRGRSWTCTACP